MSFLETSYCCGLLCNHGFLILYTHKTTVKSYWNVLSFKQFFLATHEETVPLKIAGRLFLRGDFQHHYSFIKNNSLSLSEDLLSVRHLKCFPQFFICFFHIFLYNWHVYLQVPIPHTYKPIRHTLIHVRVFIISWFLLLPLFFCVALAVRSHVEFSIVVKMCSTVSFSFSVFVCSSNSTATWSTKKLWNTILQASSSWLVVMAVNQKSLIGQLQVQHETNTHENKKMRMAVIIVHFSHCLALHLYSRQFPFITSEFIQFDR